MNTKTKILLTSLVAGAIAVGVITEPALPSTLSEKKSIDALTTTPSVQYSEVEKMVVSSKASTHTFSTSSKGKINDKTVSASSGVMTSSEKSELKNEKSSSPSSKKDTSSKNTSSKSTSSKAAVKNITASNVRAKPLSVSSLEVTWTAEKNREYNIEVYTDAGYVENIDFVFKNKGQCYITGLREDSDYDITVTPILTESEKKKKTFKAVSGKASTSTRSAGEVIQEYEYEDGWTSCFAGERASGLTAMPSSGAIYGSKVDEVTGTGIRRFENGDYCCAMGEWYGECGDRFLVELENGIQFTVRICDSKGWADDADGDGTPDGRFHWFGGTGNGKCVIEFIYDDGNLPGCVAFSGSWGYYNWNGLNLSSNIKQIQKLATW